MSNTLIVIAHNAEKTINPCLKSLELFIDNTVSNVIVVDNCSTDKTGEIIQKRNDISCVIFDDEEGIQSLGSIIKAISENFELADYITVMDAGLMITPNCISRAVDTLDKNGDVLLVSGNSYDSNSGIEYDILIEKAYASDKIMEQVVGINSFPFTVRKKDLTGNYRFDINIKSVSGCLVDYSLNVTKNNMKIAICPSAYYYRIFPFMDYADSTNDRELLEEKHHMHYFNQYPNTHLTEMIKHGCEDSINVLEIGCDCGATLLDVKNKYPNSKVYGVEINSAAAAVASHFANVQVGNIEEKNLNLPEGYFDYIFFGDVLEHLRDPYKTIVYCKKLLKKGGYIISNIPNLMHISVMKQLLNGMFTYTEIGLLDRTHIHFFTYNEICNMFKNAGYSIESISSVTATISDEDKKLIDELLKLGKAEKYMYETFQYLVVVKN